MKKIFIFLILFCLVVGITSRRVPTAFAASCPQSTDMGYDDDATSCSSGSCTRWWSKTGASGAGVNTMGGNLTCLCTWGDSSCGTPVTCVEKETNGACYPGTGGYGAFSNGCTRYPNSSPITCPSPLPLNIKVVDAGTQQGIPGIPMTIYYGDVLNNGVNPSQVTATTDTSGNISITNKLYSGMHFYIVPQSTAYRFSPTQIGAAVNDPTNHTGLGNLEMNTGWSCGTSPLGDGTVNANPVCIFNATVLPTPTPSPSPTPTPTPSPTPTPTPSATPTPTPQSTAVSLSIGLHGIGSGGDNVAPTSGSGYKNPQHPTRHVTVSLSDANNNQLTPQTGTIVYNTTSGLFDGTVALGATVPTGNYLVRITSPGFLVYLVPKVITLTNQQTTKLDPVYLVNGDINIVNNTEGDNELDIQDYNTLLSCYNNATGSSCLNPTTSSSSGADLDDDGTVGGADYNLFLRELSTQHGTQ